MVLSYKRHLYKGVAEFSSDSFYITIRFISPFYTIEFVNSNKDVEVITSTEIRIKATKAFSLRS